ncbi:HAD family hydrolase [Salinarimonas soli]|uniref:HAD family hydrolase n=1 Tax=Salinarimonas soli TaxID=1638099 RepID=A0A5B2VBI9_9HYPH|nr:HAD family hydrolase [Salinarimonas soli]KAA2235537.1 HAD family hydrolase [Salinarimonas soli]
MLPRVIAFDGDDTLWHNETLFSMTQERFRAILRSHLDLDPADLDARLLETERRNLRAYGYGIKGFVLSMVETAIELTDGRIPAADIAAILRFGRAMLDHPVELIEGVGEVLDRLRGRDHELWLVTKGDLFDQESKIARSGLEAFFDRIEIVSEKDQRTYRRLLDRHGIAPDEFAMVGNSVRSDILPVVALGARAFHVPYAVTWAHEHVEGDLPDGALALKGIADLLHLRPAG